MKTMVMAAATVAVGMVEPQGSPAWFEAPSITSRPGSRQFGVLVVAVVACPCLGLDRPRLDSLKQIYLGDPTLLQNTLPLYAKNCVGGLMNHKKKRRSTTNPRPPCVVSSLSVYLPKHSTLGHFLAE